MEERTYWSARRWSRRTVIRGAGLAGAGLAGAALLGCGEDEEEPAATSAPTQAGGTAAATEVQVSAGKPGGRLQLSVRGDPPEFDMHHSSTSDTNAVTSLNFNQLVKMDPLVGDERPDSVIADIATEWEISPDGQTYTFHLVQNAKFHNGEPLTAADVKASYDRQLNPPADLVGPPRGAQIQWIESIDTPDDATVVFNMNRPVSSLSVLPIFAQGWMVIYSKKDIDGGFDFKKQVNGTGPYILQSYEAGSKLVYDRNPEYFVAERPYLDGVDFYIVADASTELANFQGGQIDIYAPSAEQLSTIEQTLGDKVFTLTTSRYGFPVMNYGGHEPWTDVRVRQAVAMAIDKQAGMDVLVFGEARKGGYQSGGGFWSLSEADLEKIPGYGPVDLAESRKLLDAAGVPAEFDGTIMTRQNRTSEDLSLFVQDQLAKIGINVVLDIQETAAAYDRFAKRDFDLGPWSHAYAVDDPDAVFAEFYVQGAPRNYSQVGNQAIDDLFLKQSMEQDPEARKQLVIDLQNLAMPEHGKTIFYWSNGRTTQWNKVKDYVPHTSTYNNRRYQDVWLDV